MIYVLKFTIVPCTMCYSVLSLSNVNLTIRVHLTICQHNINETLTDSD